MADVGRKNPEYSLPDRGDRPLINWRKNPEFLPAEINHQNQSDRQLKYHR
jgi:hypothetical protein